MDAAANTVSGAGFTVTAALVALPAAPRVEVTAIVQVNDPPTCAPVRFKVFERAPVTAVPLSAQVKASVEVVSDHVPALQVTCWPAETVPAIVGKVTAVMAGHAAVIDVLSAMRELTRLLAVT